MSSVRWRHNVATMLLLALAVELTARPVLARGLWGSTKSYSKWVAGVGLNVVRAGTAAGWFARVISAAAAKATLLVTTAATAGTLVGQGINYGISRRWDPEPIYPTGGGPIFTSISDEEIDALLPQLFEFAGWSDDPNTHFPFTVEDILAADVDLHPGIGTAALNYLHASVRTFVDVHQGAAVFWAEGRTSQFFAARDAIELDLIQLQLAAEEFGHLISQTVIETVDGPMPLESTVATPGLVIDGLWLAEFEDWFVELDQQGVAALPDTEPALVEFLQQVANVAQPEPIGDDLVAWALADPDNRLLEYELFGPDGFHAFSELLRAGIDTFWSRVDLDASALVCPGDLDGDGWVGLADLAQLLANYGTTGGAGFEDGDLDADGDVDLADLAALLAVYDTTCGVALWAETFDFYPPGASLHGLGRWKGWDNDPAFEAFVTDAQARSAPHAVDIAGGADLVHQYHGVDSGRWLFAAWQYIPSDFSSGGGNLPGSFFILLNTYADGGPHQPSDWSVQCQFDSNDGMLKVFHGDGMNTVNVPYVTDRWAAIEVIVDLDDDWTQVYYDDALIIEYSWTGGILGGGGGAPNIAAVDLYAQDSTSIFYDDLSLAPLPR